MTSSEVRRKKNLKCMYHFKKNLHDMVVVLMTLYVKGKGKKIISTPTHTDQALIMLQHMFLKIDKSFIYYVSWLKQMKTDHYSKCVFLLFYFAHNIICYINISKIVVLCKYRSVKIWIIKELLKYVRNVFHLTSYMYDCLWMSLRCYN